MNKDLRRFEIKGQFYNLEPVAESIRRGKWNEANDALMTKIGLTRDEAREIARQVKAINEGTEYIPPQRGNKNINFNMSYDSGSISKLIKITAVGTAIVGFIISISLGWKINSWFDYYEGSSTGLGVGCLGTLMSISLGIVIFSLGEIVDILNDIRRNTGK